jgi:hypothetical protein
MRLRREELADEVADNSIVAPTAEELTMLRQRVTEAVSEGSPGPVKALLQHLIHEIRVDSRDAIHPIFRVPVGGDNPVVDAVCAPSSSVEVKGLEPSASTFRKCGSRCHDQALSEDFPDSGVSIPSGSLTIPPLPAR